MRKQRPNRPMISRSESIPVPDSAKFCGATVFVPHPTNGTCLYVSRRGAPEKLGGVPGGKVDPGETYQDAALREFREETGLELERISDDCIFSGIALKSMAFCHVFLGSLSDESWANIESKYVGPEGLNVRVADWKGLMDENECEFAEFNMRFFSKIQNSLQVQDTFNHFNLDSPFEAILATKITLLDYALHMRCLIEGRRHFERLGDMDSAQNCIRNLRILGDHAHLVEYDQ